MAPALAPPPPRPITAAQKVAALADAFESRARSLAPLLDHFRAHLDAVAPGRSRPPTEHLLELLDLGLRRRSVVPPSRRARAARSGGVELARLASLLQAAGCPETTLSRLRAWRDFALAEDVREVMAVADELCDWFEDAAGRLGEDLFGPDDAFDLVRTEVLGRSLLLRPQVFARGLLAHPPPSKSPGASGQDSTRPSPRS